MLMSSAVHRPLDAIGTGDGDQRGGQTSALIRQNEILKAYVKRLEQQLIDYMGTHLPPPTSTLPGHPPP